jgi:hypothetical protein
MLKVSESYKTIDSLKKFLIRSMHCKLALNRFNHRVSIHLNN